MPHRPARRSRDVGHAGSPVLRQKVERKKVPRWCGGASPLGPASPAALGPELFLSTPVLLRGGLLQPLALLEGGLLQPLASLEGKPPQIHEQELLQLHALPTFSAAAVSAGCSIGFLPLSAYVACRALVSPGPTPFRHRRLVGTVFRAPIADVQCALFFFR